MTLTKYLSINTFTAPPHFQEKHERVSVGQGNTAALTCDVTGDPPIELTWYKDNLAISSSLSYRYLTHNFFYNI